MNEAECLTVIIPTLNAARQLGALLRDLGLAPFPLEVRLADGGSRDGTQSLAATFGCRVIPTDRGRGIQLAAAAEPVRHGWLLFLHADCRLPPDWADAVSAFVKREAAGDAVGYFRLAFASSAPAARRVEYLANWRSRWLALPYGDQGLLISARLYHQLGGYPEWPLMEDVALIRRIGRRRLKLLAATIETSATRYEQEGWWRRPLRNLSCLLLYFLGVRPSCLIRFYYGGAWRG